MNVAALVLLAVGVAIVLSVSRRAAKRQVLRHGTSESPRSELFGRDFDVFIEMRMLIAHLESMHTENGLPRGPGWPAKPLAHILRG